MEKAVVAPARLMRVIRFSFAASGLLFAYVVMTVPAQAPRPVDPPVEVAFTAVAFMNVVLGFLAPRLFALAPQNKGKTALNRWLSRSLVSLALFESCTLFGVTLHFIGGRLQLVALLIAVGIISTLVWRPGDPPADDDGKLSRA